MTVSKVLFSSKSDEWATPPELFEALNNEFDFTLDVCATEKNHKCKRYFTQADNGLSQKWGGGSDVFAIRHTARSRHG